MLLVREAGGFVTDFRGGDRTIERNEFLAANDALHMRDCTNCWPGRLR